MVLQRVHGQPDLAQPNQWPSNELAKLFGFYDVQFVHPSCNVSGTTVNFEGGPDEIKRYLDLRMGEDAFSQPTLTSPPSHAM